MLTPDEGCQINAVATDSEVPRPTDRLTLGHRDSNANNEEEDVENDSNQTDHPYRVSNN